MSISYIYEEGLMKRQTNESAVCQPDECDSSLIPLNNTIVVPGGRYREIYYWDSYWVLQGLLKSELYDYATDLIRNFMDFIRVSPPQGFQADGRSTDLCPMVEGRSLYP